MVILFVLGIAANKNGFGYAKLEPSNKDISFMAKSCPANLSKRPQQLKWIYDEARALFEADNCCQVALQKPNGGIGLSRERVEVEGVIKAAASGLVEVHPFTKDQVRAALGITKRRGAYEALLKREDVAAHSNKARREQYVLALAGAAR